MKPATSTADAQGFARVAACTVPVHLPIQPLSPAEVIEQARACDEEAPRSRSQLGPTGYSVDDLFLQDARPEGALG